MTKRMQRILSTILVLSVMIACFVSPASAAEDFSEFSTQCIDRLTAFGIFDDTTEKDIVTRSGFVSYVLKLINHNAVIGDGEVSVFDDVETNIADINEAKRLGIISGSGTSFFPDQEITGTDAAVMLIGALGYTAAVDKNSAYPVGYTKLAGELQLFRGAEADMNEPLSYEQIAVVFQNALNTKLMYQETDSRFVKSKDITALNYYHDIYRAKDIVNANDKTNLTGGDEMKDNRVMIGDTIYEEGQSGTGDYLGCRVEYYYFDDGKIDMPVIKYAQPDSGTKRLFIEAGDIEGLDDTNRLQYYDKNERTKSVLIPSDILIVFNGKPSVDIQREDFKPESGSLELLDNDGNGRYDILFIKSYQTVVVNSVFAEYERVRDYVTGDYVEFKDYERLTISVKGIEIDVKDLKKWDILSIAETKDKKYADIVVGRDKASGKIESIDEDIIKINGEEYRISEYMNNLILNGRIRPESGAAATVYLDSCGEAVICDTSMLAGRYGIIISLLVDEIEETCELRILDREDGEQRLGFAKNVTIDGVRCKKREIVDKMCAAMTRTYFGVVPMVYEINAEQQLTKIETPAGKEMKELCYNEEYYYVCTANTFLKDRRDGSFFAGSSTFFCYVPDDPKNTEEYKLRNLSQITGDIDQNICAFTIGSSRIADFVLIKKGTGSHVVGGGESLAIVTGKSTGLDENDEVINLLNVWKNREKTKIPLNNSVDADGIEKGDIIFFNRNEDGVAEHISEIYKPGNLKTFAVSAVERGRIAGRVYYKEGTVIGVVTDLTKPDQMIYFNLYSPPTIYVCDALSGEVTLGTIDDIQDYASSGETASDVFIQTNYTRILNVVVYK